MVGMFVNQREWVETPILDGKIQGGDLVLPGRIDEEESFYGNGIRQVTNQVQ